ncbi:hypothetical protein KKJ25_09350 [Xenorhabdus bovienii]|uniref:hypothetical protein n=1 Tax=Xenorhabdus bovienii TaxID=40576 RepID=UPI00237C63B5|nr:hypothetical protein [Xenorhabdus bovienii]MDE1495145.1 hypothetical protein [Xenorhabdus bovienii]MDE9473229.1 hypothetical protein [Xenorhabdus bovienii]
MSEKKTGRPAQSVSQKHVRHDGMHAVSRDKWLSRSCTIWINGASSSRKLVLGLRIGLAPFGHRLVTGLRRFCRFKGEQNET